MKASQVSRRTRLGRACEAVALLYATALCLRCGAGLLLGDRWWWLALANTFALYLFAPLPFVAALALLLRRRWAWVALATGAALFAALYGPLFMPRTRSVAADRPALRVLTFNTPFPGYGADEQALIDSILRQQADIVLLQELTPRGVQALQRGMAAHYPYILVETEGMPGEGKLILSRYPLTLLPRLGSVTPTRAAQRALAQIDGRAVVLVNIHPTATAGVARLQDVPSYVAETFARREREIAEVHAALRAETRPVIIAGDFNASDQTAAYRLLGQDYGDSWREAGSGFGHTFPAPVFRMADLPFPLPEAWKVPGGLLDRPVPERLVRIDHILHSHHLRAVQAWTVDLGQSDHIAVGAVLVWGE